ncbi:unnamed protein product [Rhizoctonia solani]|uniref:Nucleolus and neural progenitor protein-like N-terminal domain-containing protein n=1 Tax=Rhizoctonia solani TaxID=456999 RepID=A0A8H3HC97_9AGAM|nr:unnamed protein product [Rhizoctonia solani]
MPQRRFRLVASADYRPRDNLDIPAITQLLKQLKSGNKNARSSQKLLFAEMHVLERVYYKGKNQHGLSLFWRSVVSVRRMSKRIYETNLPGLLETLGGMFHEEPFEGQKVFSGAWTRVPPSANVAQILERLLDIEVLLKSAVVSFQKAYRAFCLAMPNTAFLQLTIVLVSIVSRTSAVATTLLETTLSIIPSIYAVFETQEPPKSLLNKISKRLKNALQTPSPEKLITPPIKPSSHIPTPMNLDDMDEDLGFSIARTSLPPTTVPALPPSPPAQVIIAPDSPTSPISPAPTTCLDIETTTPSSPLPAPPSQPPRAQIIPKNVPVEPAVHAAPVATSTKPKKKRKKTRDEIDDIFG